MMKTQPEELQMPWWEHLEDLRKTLISSLVGFFVAVLICWFFREQILAFLSRPFQLYFEGETFQFTIIQVTEAFFFYLKISMFGGIFLSSPWIFYQIWRFVAPGLYAREKVWVLTMVFASTLFFLTGAFFGYAYILPLTLRFLLNIGKDFRLMITTTHYFSFFIQIILATGIVFELPVFSFLLGRIGIIRHEHFLKFWKYAVAGAFIISAIITPSGDMVTQTVLALPMIALYFFSALVVAFAEKLRKRSHIQESSDTPEIDDHPEPPAIEE